MVYSFEDKLAIVALTAALFIAVASLVSISLPFFSR